MAYLKISDFSKVAMISRKNLIVYDTMGLLKPAYVDGANGYRMYSYHQLDTAILIRALRQIEMPLKDIKAYIGRRTPDELMKLCAEYKRKVEDKIEALKRVGDMIDVRAEQTRYGMDIKNLKTRVIQLKEEYLFLGPVIPPVTSLGQLWGHLPSFYAACEKNGIPNGLPLGIIKIKDRSSRGQVEIPRHFFCKLPNAHDYAPCHIKPSGRYVEGFQVTHYALCPELYTKLNRYIHKNKLDVVDFFYEEYVLDEIAMQKTNEFLLRVTIGLNS